jgi:hypothetical protein
MSYFNCASEDILEYLAYQILFQQQFYGFQMYPGKEYACSVYLQNKAAMESVYVSLRREKDLEKPGAGLTIKNQNTRFFYLWAVYLNS